MGRYSETLLDHAQYPRNATPAADTDAVGLASLNGQAPYVMLFLRLDQSTVSSASFQTFGCGVAIACCSVLTELATGRRVEDCLAIRSEQLVDALGGVPADKQFCAELAIAALRNALNRAKDNESDRDAKRD